MRKATADGAQFFEPRVDVLLFLQHVAFFFETHFLGNIDFDTDDFIRLAGRHNRDEHVVENHDILGDPFTDGHVVVVLLQNLDIFFLFVFFIERLFNSFVRDETLRFAFITCQEFLWQNLVVRFGGLQQVPAALDIRLVLRHEHALLVLGPKAERKRTDKRIQEVFTLVDFLFPDVQSFLITDLVELVFLELFIAVFDNLLVMERVGNIAEKGYVIVCCQ